MAQMPRSVTVNVVPVVWDGVENLLQIFSEWLDAEGLIVSDRGPHADKRTHEDLAREFLAAQRNRAMDVIAEEERERVEADCPECGAPDVNGETRFGGNRQCKNNHIWTD